MKRSFSYFVLKPDGIRYIDDICETIEGRFDNVIYYYIEDFEDIIKKLYHKHYEEKGEKFAGSFESYLYGLKEIFGNKALLMLIGDRSSQKELAQKVFNTKIEIREKYGNDNIGIVTNHKGNEQSKKLYIRLIDEKGEQSKTRILSDLGYYRISDMNTIHCPDPDVEITAEELNIIYREGVLNPDTVISKEIMDNVKKYKTLNIESDLREQAHKRKVVSKLQRQPNISEGLAIE